MPDLVGSSLEDAHRELKHWFDREQVRVRGMARLPKPFARREHWVVVESQPAAGEPLWLQTPLRGGTKVTLHVKRADGEPPPGTG